MKINKKMNLKCLKSLSGKHLWIERLVPHSYRMIDVIQVKCEYCGVINDIKSESRYE